MTTLAVPMARKTSDSEGEKPRQRKSRDSEPRPIALTVRGRPAWKEWVQKLAEFERIAVNELVDRSLVRYAREAGFKEQAPER